MELIQLLEGNNIEGEIEKGKEQIMFTPTKKDKFKNFSSVLNENKGSTQKEISLKTLDYMVGLIEETTEAVESLPKYSCSVLAGEFKLDFNQEIDLKFLTKNEMLEMKKDFDDQSRTRIKNYQSIINNIKNDLAEISNENVSIQQQKELLRRSIIVTKAISPPKREIKFEKINTSFNINSCKNRTPRKENTTIEMPKGFSSPTNEAKKKRGSIKKKINKTFDPMEKQNKLISRREYKTSTNYIQSLTCVNQTTRTLQLTDYPFEQNNLVNSNNQPCKSINALLRPVLPTQNNATSKMNFPIKKEKFNTPTIINQFKCISPDKRTSIKSKNNSKKDRPISITECFIDTDGYDTSIKTKERSNERDINKEKDDKSKINKVKQIKETILKKDIQAINGQHYNDKDESKLRHNQDKDKHQHLNENEQGIDCDNSIQTNNVEEEDKKMRTLPYPSRQYYRNHTLFTPSPIKIHRRSYSQTKRMRSKQIIQFSFDQESEKSLKQQTCCIGASEKCLIF